MNYLELAVRASLEAGKRILEVYQTSFTVELKEDRSPLTLADRESHRIITENLESTGIPILSEEGISIPYETRKNWTRFWLVDPLDGTKEFVKRNDEFTVNIALMEANRPVLGVIYAPVLGLLYYAQEGLGAFKQEVDPGVLNVSDLLNERYWIAAGKSTGPYTVVASKSHFSQDTGAYIDELRKRHPDLAMVSRGSSLKLCLIAEGSASIYPRLGPTMEWDTAAGHAIVECAGGSVNEYGSGKPLPYNKSELLNPWFVASEQP